MSAGADGVKALLQRLDTGSGASPSKDVEGAELARSARRVGLHVDDEDAAWLLEVQPLRQCLVDRRWHSADAEAGRWRGLAPLLVAGERAEHGLGRDDEARRSRRASPPW